MWNALIRGSTTFFGARFCRRAVVEKADLHSAVVVGVVVLGRAGGCGLLWRVFDVRYLQTVEGRKMGRKAEKFIMVSVIREGRNWRQCRLGIIGVTEVQDFAIAKTLV
jgi:hypothetical protein